MDGSVMASLDPVNVVVAVAVLGLLAVFSYKKHIVTKSGLVAAFLLGLGIWLLSSWAWFFLMLLFFLITAQFTHYKYQLKRRYGAAQDKGGARAWPNVLANGVLPLSFAVASFALVMLLGGDAYGRTTVGVGLLAVQAVPVTSLCFAAFLGALATATADTLATEIGLLNPTPPRLITKPRRLVPPGTSGGVSLAGELATVMGSLLIGGAAAILASPFWLLIAGYIPLPLASFAPVTMVVVAVAGGFVGCTVDSLLGATIQGMWRCRVCGKLTEKKSHCGEPADYVRGNRFFDNHVVNLVSGLVGALVAALLYLGLFAIALA